MAHSSREMKMAQVSCIIVAGKIQAGEMHNITVNQMILKQKTVSVFILCHGVRWIPNVYELTRAEDKEVKEIQKFLQEF